MTEMYARNVRISVTPAQEAGATESWVATRQEA